MQEPQPFTPDQRALVEALYLAFPHLKPDARDGLTVQEIMDRYLRDAPHDVAPDCLDWRVGMLRRFVKDFGERLAVSLTPSELREWIPTANPRWRSPWVLMNVNIVIQRAFNWAVKNRVIRENPVKGVHFRPGEPRRAMSDAEYRSLLRASPPHLKRVLVFLRFTGCRPAELRALRWQDIDWRGIAILAKHKTAKKTGKPRVLFFTPVVLKLLRWLQRNNRVATAEWLRRLLRNGPVRMKEVARKAKANGISYRMLFLARQALKVKARRKGGAAWRGYYVYELPDPPPPAPEVAPDDFVFLCGKDRPWKTRQVIARALSRVRERAGVPDDVTLYCLRHAFATDGLRRGVGLVPMSLLMGHSGTRTIQQYCHLGEDAEYLLRAMQQATGQEVRP